MISLLANVAAMAQAPAADAAFEAASIRQNLSGSLFAVLLAIHDEKSDEQVTTMQHDYDRLITTHIHNKIDGDRCLEIFLIKGKADEIKAMTKKFQSNKKMDHVKLIAM